MNRDAAIEVGRQAAFEVLVAETGPCSCIPAYKDRGLIDPECSYHDLDPEYTAGEVAAAVVDAALPHLVGEPVGWAVVIPDGFYETLEDARQDARESQRLEPDGSDWVYRVYAIVPVEDQP